MPIPTMSPGLYVHRIKALKGFVDEVGIAKAGGCRGGQNVQPAGSNNSRTERNFAGINQMNAHPFAPSLGGLAQAGRVNAPGLRSWYCLITDLTAYEFRSTVRCPNVASIDEIVVSWGCRKLVNIEHFLKGGRRYSANSR